MVCCFKVTDARNNPNFNPLDYIYLYMLSNNHTSDHKYGVKLEFSCWISEFPLHIFPTSNKGFLYLILIMMWQMFEFRLCFLFWDLWTFRHWKIQKKISNYPFRADTFRMCHSTTWHTSLYCILPVHLHCSYSQYCTRVFCRILFPV